MRARFSLITVVSGRKQHLYNLLEGVRKNTVRPDDIVIVSINETLRLETFPDLPINIIHLTHNKNTLPIGEARNLGARNALYNHFFFLDVDCIPAEDYFETILHHSSQFNALIMGRPAYLSKPIERDFTVEDLKKNSRFHPARPQISALLRCNNYSLFWSLCFYISRLNFYEIGGFDPKFRGYGAEDTDFAFAARANNIPFYLSYATVYHQPHEIYNPPLHHFNSIVANSQVFYSKWNEWPMIDHLRAFKKKKLVTWHEDHPEIKIKRMPSEDEINESFVPNAPYI